MVHSVHRLIVAWMLLGGAAPLSKLEEAKQLLIQGRLDEVLFTLEGEVPKEESEKVSLLLSEAARQALEKEDPVLALHFVQLSLRRLAKNALALEVGARASLATQQFESAERYADQWISAAPKRPEPSLLRAEIALTQGEWAKAVQLTQSIDAAQLSSEDRGRLKEQLQTAHRELAQRAEGRAQAEAMQKQLEEQMERAAKVASAPRPAAHKKGPVILYSTRWCGYCKQAAAWFKAKGISFEEKDIEKDRGAAKELSEKKRAAGRRGAGVPWIDVGGQLVEGFDKPALERLLL